jgi:hypothetical protein
VVVVVAVAVVVQVVVTGGQSITFAIWTPKRIGIKTDCATNHDPNDHFPNQW